MNLIELATHTQSQLDQLSVRIDTLAAEHDIALAAAIAEKDAIIAVKDAEITTLKTQYTELLAYKTAMEEQVSAVLQSGDPAQYEALAVSFLTPAQEKERQATLARIEVLKAETLALEESLKAKA